MTLPSLLNALFSTVLYVSLSDPMLRFLETKHILQASKNADCSFSFC